MACTNCHVAHGSAHPFSLRVDINNGTEGDKLCTQCHSSYASPRTTASHSFHAANSAASRCINCHMRVRYARALDELAQGLSEFNDVAANHAALGWLEAERGRPPQAHIALERATRMDPAAARPWVVRGVIAARDGKIDQSFEYFRKARLDPAYPMIDQLISEAEKRKRPN